MVYQTFFRNKKLCLFTKEGFRYPIDPEWIKSDFVIDSTSINQRRYRSYHMVKLFSKFHSWYKVDRHDMSSFMYFL